MPDERIIRNAPAIAAQVDASGVAGEALFSRVDGLNNVQTATLHADASIFWDLPAFLHGYGSSPGASLNDLVSVGWTGPGSIKVVIDANDFIAIKSTDAPIKLEPSSSNAAFGLPAEGAFSVMSGGFYVIQANQPWSRGVVELSELMEITDTNSGITYTFIDDYPRVQSLPTWIRERGTTGDADDIWLDATVEDADPQLEAHWLVEADGRVSCSYYEDNGFLFGNNSEFWRILGGTTGETPVDGVGGRKTITTTYAAPSFLALNFPYVSFRRKIAGRDEHRVMADGRVVSSGLPPIKGWALRLRVSGPAFGPSVDQEKHLRDWWQEARRNLTLYPQWATAGSESGCMDLRRHADARLSLAHERYTLGTTVEADDTSSHYGKRKGGRLMLRRAPSDNQDRVEQYAHELDLFQDIDLHLLDRVDL